MKRIMLVILCAVVSLTLLSVVLAKQGETDSVASAPSADAKNVTYGQCVSEHAKLKNDCFASVKEARVACVANTTETATCKQAYKKDMKQCKTEFKVAKKECRKIKHSFFEGARHAFA